MSASITMNRVARRRFLRNAAAGGIAYALARTPGVAWAQMGGGGNFADYRALVCVFLFGGNDSWNMVVPRSQAEYNAYAASRQNLAVPLASLLPINLAVPDPAGWLFGLHPSMTGIATLFNSGRAAFVANIGPLLAPTALTQYQNRSVPLPPQLFSHNDQQDQWHTLKGNAQSKAGWAGRIADARASRVATQQMPLNVSLAGQTLFLAGNATVPYTMGASGPTAFAGFGTTGMGLSRRQAFEAVLRAPHPTVYQQAFAAVQQRAVQFGDGINAALNDPSTPNFISLPNSPPTPLSGLATQLRTVAKLIAMRDRLQMSRQVFFVSTGGFDTHDDQLNDQPNLLTTVSDALSRFDDAMQQIAMSQSVTAFTQSDFGRTLTSNGDGTDHAWGGLQLVTGGAVAGGRIYGQFPLLRIGARVGTDRADDVGGGRFIPTVSSDQYAATLARWFGVADADLALVAPSINSFAQRDLGFMI
jgi:uncharacterized protein (DUF1501 family)